MPERWEVLKSKLAELEAELARVDSLDAETRRALEVAAEEIGQVLSRDRSAKPAATLSAKLSDQAREFEASHPTLSTAVFRLVDALGQIGI